MIRWFDYAPPIPKDKRMPMTEEYFYKILAMDAELIDEMRGEIQNLKMTINKLRQKASSHLVISPIEKIK
tara:strand:+ start:1387 stop:1596 length:210 start_codon:yes stop_codon:yes gene_type:complete